MASPRQSRADWQSAEESDGGVVGPRLRALNGRRGGRPLLLQRSVKITSPRDAPHLGIERGTAKSIDAKSTAWVPLTSFSVRTKCPIKGDIGTTAARLDRN